MTNAALVSGGSNAITFVPPASEFEKADIWIHSTGIVSRFVVYMGMIVPVEAWTAERVTPVSM